MRIQTGYLEKSSGYGLTWEALTEKRTSYHRWFYLVVALLWTVLLWDEMVHHPWRVSSFGVPNVILGLAPLVVLAWHIIVPSVLSWGFVCSAFGLLYTIAWVQGFNEGLQYVLLSKWNLFTYFQCIFFSLFVLTAGAALFYLTRPRSTRGGGRYRIDFH